MNERIIYSFEDLSDDLPRPPMAAMRALMSSGIIVSTKGWAALPHEARWAIAMEGVKPAVDPNVVQALLRQAAVSELRLVPRMTDPSATSVPPDLEKVMGPLRTLYPAEWGALTPIDRYVLMALSLNTRLLSRAVLEILPAVVESSGGEPWKAAVAHCEVRMRPETIERLKSPSFLDGRAFVLARVAGVRAARRASETFDLRSETTIGAIELDWAPGDKDGTVLWQAHVSSWDGSFFHAASFAAATTAAVAICDMAAEKDPLAAIVDARIAEEPWRVGSEMHDGATAVFTTKEANALRAGGASGVDKARAGGAVPGEVGVSTLLSCGSVAPLVVVPVPRSLPRATPPPPTPLLGMPGSALVALVFGLVLLLLIFVVTIMILLFGRRGRA